MQFHLRLLFWIVVLLSGLSTSDVGVMALPPQSSEKTDFQFFLTAFGKGDSPAALQEMGLSVLVDKTPAQVKAVRSAKDDPLLFAVLVDISRSNASMADSIKEAALQIFQRLSSIQNQGYLVLFSSEVVVSPNPISVSQAKQALDSASFQEGGTAVYDAIEQICKHRLSRSGNPAKPRRVILLISDGEDNASRVTHTRAEQAALEEGVSVFSLVIRAPFPITGPLPGRHGEEFLKEVSQKTGGFSTDKDLKKAVLVSLTAVEAEWVVTFAPVQSADKALHELTVKSTQKGVHIYAPYAVLLQ